MNWYDHQLGWASRNGAGAAQAMALPVTKANKALKLRFKAMWVRAVPVPSGLDNLLKVGVARRKS